MPGFASERSLFASSSQHVMFNESGCNNSSTSPVVGAFGGDAAIMWLGPTPDFENSLNWPGSTSIAAEGVPEVYPPCRPVTGESASVLRTRSVPAIAAGPNTVGFVPTIHSREHSENKARIAGTRVARMARAESSHNSTKEVVENEYSRICC